MNSVNRRLLGLVVIAAITLMVGNRHASADIFQEGVSPNGSYTTDATYITTASAGVNFNSDPDNEIIVGTTNSNAIYRGLLEFDVSSIPATDSIDLVSLNLTTRDPGNGIGGTQTYSLYSYGLDFVETGATWNDPDVGGTDVAGGTLGTLLGSISFDGDPSGASATFPDSAAFRTAVSGALGSDGFLRMILVGNETQNSTHQFARFASDENTTLGSRPELVVEHSAAVPEPSSFAMFGIVGLVALGRRRK